MSKLRNIRIALALLFLVATLIFFTVGRSAGPLPALAEKAQVIPSALASCMGAFLFWLGITFLFGRVYCSTVCPVGTISDLAMKIRRAFPRLRKPFSFKPTVRQRYDILIAYIICLIFGLFAVPYILEPWNLIRDLASLWNPGAVATTWLTLGVGLIGGMISGAVGILAVLIWGFLSGRDLCNVVCPVGTAMSLLHNHTLFHIEIDPDKCISCMKCEDICRSSCVKVVSRHVDNSRCVRCFDCLAVCPNNAIRMQINRNRAATPLLRKKSTTV